MEILTKPRRILSAKDNDKKIASFKVPTFRGDTLDDDDSIYLAKTIFGSNTMLDYLEFIPYCDNSPC